MAPENSTVGVQLIEHDETQVLEQAHPFCVVRQNASVQHVRIRQDDVSTFANRFSGIIRGIAVIRKYSETVIKPFRQVSQFGQLILGERLGRKQVQGASVGI